MEVQDHMSAGTTHARVLVSMVCWSHFHQHVLKAVESVDFLASKREIKNSSSKHIFVTTF